MMASAISRKMRLGTISFSLCWTKKQRILF
jgi:hypothetical protein